MLRDVSYRKYCEDCESFEAGRTLHHRREMELVLTDKVVLGNGPSCKAWLAYDYVCALSMESLQPRCIDYESRLDALLQL